MALIVHASTSLDWILLIQVQVIKRYKKRGRGKTLCFKAVNARINDENFGYLTGMNEVPPIMAVGGGVQNVKNSGK